MTHALLKRISALGLGIGIAAAVVQPGWAMEGGGGTENTKPGAFIGASAGVPPPGIYMFNQVFTYQANIVGPGAGPQVGNPGFGGTNAFGQSVKVHKQVWVDVQGFVFVPGWTFLGGTYDAVVVQPWVSASLAPFAPNGAIPGGLSVIGAFDTYVVPFELAWKFGDSGFNAKIGLAMYVPTGNIIGPAGLSNVGNPWWTFQPELILSYLKDGWNISAFLYQEFMTKNFYDDYQNGSIFHLDFNVLKTIGKWTFGPVGYYVTQVSSDTPSALHPTNGGKQARFAVGGLVGYDFGAASVSVWGTQEVWQKTEGGFNPATPLIDTAIGTQGFTIFGTLSYRLWAPEEPAPMPKHPLVYK